jgi:hypothetical protein
MFDLTDKEALHRLRFDQSFRWALDVQFANDDTLYVSPKTFYNFKQLILKNELDKVIFCDSTNSLLDEFRVNHSLQRMDSMHFNSNMKRLSRFGVMNTTVEKFLKDLKKESSQTFDTIEPILVERYLKKDVQGFNYFGRVRPSHSDNAMLTMANDIFTLINLFESNPLVAAMPAFALLNRVFNDQCKVNHDEKILAGSKVVLKDENEIDILTTLNLDENDFTEGIADVPEISDTASDPKVEMRPAKEISSDSLQNPSDPDAAYSGHKGQGYHVQVVETYTPKDSESNEPSLNLITYVEVEKANEPDSNALRPALDELEARGLLPDEMPVDTAYGGDANQQYAASKGVELVSPVAGNGAARAKKIESFKLTPSEEMIDMAQTISFANENAAWLEMFENDATEPTLIRLADFQSDERGVIKACPMGNQANTQRNHDNTGGRAYFNREACLKCPLCGYCPITISKNKAWLSYQDEQVRLDKRRIYQETAEFKDRYRWRSGIEATNSQLARIGAKRLRVRGLNRSRLKMHFKALALNAMRVIAYVSQKSKKIADN